MTQDLITVPELKLGIEIRLCPIYLAAVQQTMDALANHAKIVSYKFPEADYRHRINKKYSEWIAQQSLIIQQTIKDLIL